MDPQAEESPLLVDFKITRYDGWNLLSKRVSRGLSRNLLMGLFSDSSESRYFSHISGESLYVQSNDKTLQAVVGTGYTSPCVAGWNSSVHSSPYTHTVNPWYYINRSVSCTGCILIDSTHSTLPYVQPDILNDLSDCF